MIIIKNSSQGCFNGCEGVYTRNVVFRSILLKLNIITTDTPSISTDEFVFTGVRTKTTSTTLGNSLPLYPQYVQQPQEFSCDSDLIPGTPPDESN